MSQLNHKLTFSTSLKSRLHVIFFWISVLKNRFDHKILNIEKSFYLKVFIKKMKNNFNLYSYSNTTIFKYHFENRIYFFARRPVITYSPHHHYHSMETNKLMEDTIVFARLCNCNTYMKKEITAQKE